MNAEEQNVFLSWSGEQSRDAARVLRDWLPQVINAVRPWMSSEDIRKGSRWSVEINNRLSTAKFGILCLTSENVNAPWVLFEAGAIAKMVDEAHVCPYLIGMKASEVPQGPLNQFQATLATEEDTLKLVRSINSALGSPRSDAEVDRAFVKWWPDLASELNNIRQKGTPASPLAPKRSSEDVLEEILTTVRYLAQQRNRRSDDDILDELIGPIDPVEVPKSESSPGKFSRGREVRHPKYGRGLVLRREGAGEGCKLTVSFPGYGLKKIVEKYAGDPVSDVE